MLVVWLADWWESEPGDGKGQGGVDVYRDDGYMSGYLG